MSVASKNFDKDLIISEEQSSEMSNKWESEPITPENQMKAKTSILIKDKNLNNNVFRGSFVGFSPPEIIIKTPEQQKTVILKRNSLNLIEKAEFFNKSFKSVVEKIPSNEKISLRTSLNRRKTSHFGTNYSFLSCNKPKILRKNVRKRLFFSLKLDKRMEF